MTNETQTIFTQYGVEAGKEKVSMESALTFLNSFKGKPLTDVILSEFATQFCMKSKKAGTGEGKEPVRLYNKDGETIGKKCSIFKLWLPISHFQNPEKSSASREAKKAKKALIAKANDIRKAAEVYLTEARGENDASAKLKLFEKYDAELAKAKEVEQGEIKVPADFKDGFATVEELAKSLNVPVILTTSKSE